METNKTLATYIALGAVFVIVLGLLAFGLTWACRRWRCPYPCCCVWRCFQDPDQLREARAYLYTAPRNISWGVRRRWPSLTMQVGLKYTYRYCTNDCCCAILYCNVSCAFPVSFNHRFQILNIPRVGFNLFARLIGFSNVCLRYSVIKIQLIINVNNKIIQYCPSVRRGVESPSRLKS